MNTQETFEITFTPIANDYYDNPRYIVHFFYFLSDIERSTFGLDTHEQLFKIALQRSRKIGGKIYRGKSHGSGYIVLESWSIGLTAKQINRIKNA